MSSPLVPSWALRCSETLITASRLTDPTVVGFGDMTDAADASDDDDDVLASLRGDFAAPFARREADGAGISPAGDAAASDEVRLPERLAPSLPTRPLTSQRPPAPLDAQDDDRLLDEVAALTTTRATATSGGAKSSSAPASGDARRAPPRAPHAPADDTLEDDDALAEEAMALAGASRLPPLVNEESEEDEEAFEDAPAPAPARARTRVPLSAPEPGSGSRALRAFRSKTTASSAPTSAAAPPASSSLPAWADAPLGAASSVVDADPREVAAALAANRALQSSLKDTIRDVETALAVNAETRRELGEAIREAKEERRASRASTVGGVGVGEGEVGDGGYDAYVVTFRPGRYFRTPRAPGTPSDRPEPNADAARPEWMRLRARAPFHFRAVKPWTSAEDKQLRRGVHYYLQKARLFSRERMTLEEVAGFGVARLEELLDRADGFASVADDAAAIDWVEVSKLFLPSRDPDDCRLRWTNCRDPRLDQGAFTEEEDDRLREIVEELGGRDWETVAERLSAANDAGDGAERSARGLRSATQCAGRFQAHLNPHLIRSAWTPEEDAVLRDFVERNGVGRWADAARLLPGHTSQQAMHRWLKLLKPGRRKGAWLKEEDEALRFAVAAYARVGKGANGEAAARPALPWTKISAHVATRTDVQCRERWTNVLDPALTDAEWTPKDDAELAAAARAHEERGERPGETVVAWSRVARQLGRGLTDKMCRNRWRVLERATKMAEKRAAKERAAEERARVREEARREKARAAEEARRGKRKRPREVPPEVVAAVAEGVGGTRARSARTRR